MARTARSRTRSTKISIPDLSDVETTTILPEEDYLLEVTEVEQDEGDKGPYLRWKFEVAEGKHKGSKPKDHITSFAENALFNLRGVLEALGVDIPDEPFDIEMDELVGLQCMGTIEHETYQGRKQNKIVDFFSADDDAKDREKGSAGAKDKGKPGSKSKGKQPEPEKIAQTDIDSMDQDELQSLVDDHELDLDLPKLKTLRKMKAAVIDALTEKDLLEE